MPEIVPKPSFPIKTKSLIHFALGLGFIIRLANYLPTDLQSFGE